MTTVSPAPRRTPSLGKMLRTGLIAGLLAALVNVALFAVARAAGMSFEIVTPVVPEPTPVQAPAVVLFTLVPGIAAGLVAWGLYRFVPRPKTVFVAVSVLFLIVSFLPDLAMPEPVTTATRAGLMAMHVVAAAVITTMVLRSAER